MWKQYGCLLMTLDIYRLGLRARPTPARNFGVASKERNILAVAYLDSPPPEGWQTQPDGVVALKGRDGASLRVLQAALRCKPKPLRRHRIGFYDL